MSKEKGKTQNKKRKLTRQEKKQIDALIRQSKGDGKPHTAQDSIPFERMYKDGICRLANGRYSKCIEFEDINYQLAQPDDKTAIFEALCDMYNSFDASISVQLSLISRHALQSPDFSYCEVNPLLFRLPLSPLLLRLQSVCLYRSYRPAARQAAAARWISPHCCSGRKN